mmetsp:Transcript_15797/g.45161  ORF Transcript_15797/g.45161 Transcript_15797/m.45161 type:complete len:237 (-) Transcript_15797:101-811(-)
MAVIFKPATNLDAVAGAGLEAKLFSQKTKPSFNWWRPVQKESGDGRIGTPASFAPESIFTTTSSQFFRFAAWHQPRKAASSFTIPPSVPLSATLEESDAPDEPAPNIGSISGTTVLTSSKMTLSWFTECNVGPANIPIMTMNCTSRTTTRSRMKPITQEPSWVSPLLCLFGGRASPVDLCKVSICIFTSLVLCNLVLFMVIVSSGSANIFKFKLIVSILCVGLDGVLRRRHVLKVL